MVYRGRVEKGVVVLEGGAALQDGTEVRVEPLAQQPTPSNGDSSSQLREGLLRFSGVVKGAPSDFARNHDHYLHGTPRR